MSSSPVYGRSFLRACRRFLTFAIVTFLAIQQLVLISPSPVQAASADLVISQVYGGGGNPGATYTHDFIELFNRGSVAVSLNGLSLQYASATGTGAFGANSGQLTELPNVTLQPGQYILIQEAGGTAGVALPLPVVTEATPINMSGSAGKVALVTGTTSLGCNGGSSVCSASALARIIDLVGYGTGPTGANFFEGSGAAPTLTVTTAALRAGDGCTDTDNNAADFTAPAPAPRTTASTFKICPNDFAPTVTGFSPTDGATNLAVDSNITVNFSEPVDVTGSWYTISCTVSGSHSATASGGPTAFTLDPTSDFAYGDTCTVTVLASQVTDQDLTDPPNNMTANRSWSFATLATDPCSASITPIHTIQGVGGPSLFVNTTVTTRGVVTGDFQGTTGLSGFFIQEQTGDNDPATSDGIFVFTPSANPFSNANISTGDLVTLSGRVVEFNTLTEIDNVTALSKCGAGSISPTVVDLPEGVQGDLERYEGMLVTFPETLTADQNFFQGRYGQVSLSSDGRLYNPTNSNPAGSPQAIAEADSNARRVIVLDDGSSAQNPNPIPYIGADNTLRAGDTVTGLTGVIDFGQINSDANIRDYRLHPTVAPTFTRENERTAAPEAVGGNVKVASFNVLNYFNGNGTGLSGAAGGFPTSRGANTLAEFNRQRAKIIAAITAISPDVVGLMELENDNADGAASAIQDLVNGLNAASAPGTYAAIVGPDPGTDEIQVGLIYKPGRVTPEGAPVNDSDPLFERHPLAQTFHYNANLEKFTVIVNHFKSKSSCPASGDPNADQGDGQGCWNVKRVQQAQALLSFISTIQGATGDDDVLVIGDLNSYGKEDPVIALTNGGLVDQIARFIEHPYSYVFDHQAGYLDHALATGSLSNQVSDVTEWHINADEPSVIDYNTEFKPQDLYTATPYRSSDHDPVVVGLNLNAPPTANAGGPYSVNEGGSVTVAATGNDPDGGTLTYDWDLDNDGNFETPGQSVTFSAAGLDGPSSRTIQVRVTDGGGLTAVSQATVNVQNVAPVVAINPAGPVTVNAPVSISGSFTDAGTPDTHTAIIDWGDGTTSPGTVTESGGNGTVTGSHTYNSVGSYTVQLTVTDDDGAPDTESTTINVGYGVVALYDQTKEHKSGSTIPVKLQLVDAAGNNLSNAGLIVHVTGITLGSTPVPGTNWDSGNANPGNNFSFVGDGYIFNLSTKNLLGPGEYTLHFTVTGDPTVHTLNFVVR